MTDDELSAGSDESRVASDRPPSERGHQLVLKDAIRVLTEAVMLTSPVLKPISRSEGGHQATEWVTSGRRAPADWAEFVTLALAGAAANAGGIEVALAGRPGSWEADGVRNLLTSTVGADEEHLFQHRTEPVIVDVYVNEIIVDRGVWSGYDDATRVLNGRYDAIGIPTVVRAPGSPASEKAMAQLQPATDDQERRAQLVMELEERLEELRLRDWQDYGRRLAVNVQVAAARRTGLRVRTTVRVDLLTLRRPNEQLADRGWGLADQLLHEAIEETALPGGGRSPLERLQLDPHGDDAGVGDA